MRYVLLFLSLINFNLLAQISTFAELKAGMTVPGSNEYISTADSRGYTYGFDLGLNFDETKSVGISVNYINNGYDNEITLNRVLSKSTQTETMQGSTSSAFTVGIITRASNPEFSELFHPYVKLFLGYSYVRVSGFDNYSTFSVSNEISESNVTGTFSLGMLFPISESLSGIGIEGNYSIYLTKEKHKQIFSFSLLYRQNIIF